MTTYKYWNENRWTEVKEIKEAFTALRTKFNYYLENGMRQQARDMEGEQIHINTGNDEYSYAVAEIESMTHNGLIFTKLNYKQKMNFKILAKQ